MLAPQKECVIQRVSADEELQAAANRFASERLLFRNPRSPDDLYQRSLAVFERGLIDAVLTHTRGNQCKAAEILGIHRATLRKKIRQMKEEKASEKG